MNTGHVSYHPEMGEVKPTAQIEASLSHYGKHYYCHTPLTLAGRGIVFMGQDTVETLVPGSHRVGWSTYKVTIAAFEKLTKQYAIVSEMLL